MFREVSARTHTHTHKITSKHTLYFTRARARTCRYSVLYYVILLLCILLWCVYRWTPHDAYDRGDATPLPYIVHYNVIILYKLSPGFNYLLIKHNVLIIIFLYTTHYTIYYTNYDVLIVYYIVQGESTTTRSQYL